MTHEVVNKINEWLGGSPQDYGDLRTHWTSQLLALEVTRQPGRDIHSSTVRRLLVRLGFAWRRARPVLVRRDPSKNRKMRAIARALRRRSPHETFYLDEADIDFNPRSVRVGSHEQSHLAGRHPGTTQSAMLPALCMPIAASS